MSSTFDWIIRFYKVYRGSGYTRVTLYALSIPVVLFTPSLIDLIALVLMEQSLIGTDYSNNIYGFISMILIFVFYIICFVIDLNYRPVNTKVKDVDKYKVKQDRKVVKQILNVFQYGKTKDRLETALNGVDWDFITDLELAENFLSPSFKLHNSEVEKAKYKFLSSAVDYNYFLSRHLFPSDNRPDYFTIPKEWLRDNRYSKYKEFEQKISERSRKLYQYYIEFYELAKKEMLVEAS